VTDRTVDTNLQWLRKKLGDNAGLIRTVWGIGHRVQPAAQRSHAD
jgi:DNA-binding response OmpR family regulator